MFYFLCKYYLTCISTHKIYQASTQGYKTFFMLYSAEHEICLANKSQITNNCIFFLAKHNSTEHEIFSSNKYENANNCWHFHIY